MTLQAAADELYGLPPEQFTAARDDFAARLRKAGERELSAAVRELRRPSVSAWLVNLLVRRRADRLDQLLEVGEGLRSAMASGAGDELRRLGDDRRTTIASLTRDAEAISGRRAGAAVLDEVRATLEAATADPTAATAVRSGRLVRALSYAGFGELPDLNGAVGLAPRPAPARRSSKEGVATPVEDAAVRGTKSGSRPTRPAKEAIRGAEAAAYEAAGKADDAQRSYESRLAEHAQSVDAVADAEGALEELRRQIDAATAALQTARQAERPAAAAAEAARRSARQAHAAAAAARSRLSEARDQSGER